MWFIGVEVEQETSAPPPKKNLGSAPAPDKSLSIRGRQLCYPVDRDLFRGSRYPPFE